MGAGTGYLQWTWRRCLSFQEWSEESQRSAVLEPGEVKDQGKIGLLLTGTEDLEKRDVEKDRYSMLFRH